MPAIEVRALRKDFGSLVAVNEVSFEVADGENFALLGPNGAGKSTLIRLLTTLLSPTAGSARVAGHDVHRDPDAVRRAIGVVPQAMTSDPSSPPPRTWSSARSCTACPSPGAGSSSRSCSSGSI